MLWEHEAQEDISIAFTSFSKLLLVFLFTNKIIRSQFLFKQ